MAQWITPGLRWLLIIVTALNIVGACGLLVTALTLRFLLVPATWLARGSVRTLMVVALALFAQSAGWLALSLSRQPTLWPLLIALAAGVCFSLLLYGRECIALYAQLRPFLPPPEPGPGETAPGIAPPAVHSSRSPLSLRASLRRLRRRLRGQA